MAAMKALALLLALAPLSAATLTRTADRLTYTDGPVALAFEAKTGAWLALTSGGAELVRGDTAFVPFDVGGERQAPVGFDGADERDGALLTRYRQGGWQIACRWRLDGARGLVVRTATVTWTGGAPTKLKGFWFRTPPAPMAADGYYFAPRRYPPSRRATADLKPGTNQWFGGSPAPLIAQVATDQSLLWLSDELTANSDHASGQVTEAIGSIQVGQRFDAQALMSPGATQTIGDAHLWIQPCDGEQALTQLHTWMRWVGHVVPADRSDWFADLVLYSYHPGGTIGSNFHDLGGFKPATALLDRIADLGCTGIWLLPLEDRSPYWPWDYYQFAAGLGTPEEYRALVARAHTLGLKVLQDCVPHGGSNTNERVKQHPEWLAIKEDGSTFDYWCFDFNYPTWREYMAGVARHYAKEYGVDGYRVDAVGGSRTPNWAPKLPYARASYAQLQGGLNMLRSLRAATIAQRPGGGLLAEVEGSVYGTVSDAVYDFAACYNVLHDLHRQPPELFVSRLRRWLHEQDCAEAEGLLRLRHIESHDSLRAGLWYGTGGERALMALSAWITGIPLVYHEAEEGNREAFRRIFAVRRALPELARGRADYLSVQAPPTVFACLRQLADQASLVLINFGAQPVEGQVTIPAALVRPTARLRVSDAMTGEEVAVKVTPQGLQCPLRLSPLGYTALTLRAGEAPRVALPASPAVVGGALAADADPATGSLRVVRVESVPVLGPVDICLPPSHAQLGAPTVSQDGGTTVVTRSAGEGRLELRYRVQPEQIRLEARWLGANQPETAALLLPVVGAQRWSATAADGRLADDYAVRHLPTTGVVGSIYRRPQGTNVLFDSLLHPFAPPALGLPAAALSATAGGRTLSLRFPAGPPVRAQWLDRLGDRRQLCALVAWRDAEIPHGADEALTLDLVPGEPAVVASDAAAAEPVLRHVAGGWQFENQHLRLDIGRSGTIRRLVRKEGAGEELVISHQDLYTDNGFTATRDRFGAVNDVEAACRVERDGSLWRLRFRGQLRGFGRFDLLHQPIDYVLDYTLSDGPTFRLNAGALPTTAPTGAMAFLALQTPLPGLASIATLRGTETLTEGAIAPRGRVAETTKLQPPAVPDTVVFRGANSRLLRLDDLRLTGTGPVNLFADGAICYLAWLDHRPTGDEAVWHACSALWTVGDEAAQPLGEPLALSGGRAARAVLRDPGFEDGRAGAAVMVNGGEALPRGTAAGSAWLAPAGGSLVASPTHSGQVAAQVTSTQSSYLLWRQPLPLSAFAAGSRWRLTAWVKGQHIVKGDVDWKVGTVRFAVTGQQTSYVSCPNLLGTFDWQPVSCELTVPAGLKGLEVQAGLNGATGTIWIDDVALERLP